jgi:hypothetical protein
MKFKKVLGWFCISALILSICCCRSGTEARVSVDENITVSRFEKDLFLIRVYDLEDSIAFLEKKYPVFFPLFTHKIIEVGGSGDPEFAPGLLAFTTDFAVYRVSKRVDELFSDFSPYEKRFGEAFGHYRNLFPGHPIPELVTCISGFNQSVITADSLLAISLDKYLGSEDEFYSLLYPPVPEYLRRVMRPENIVPDAMKAWVITEFSYQPKADNLVSQMIFQGRAAYCTKLLIPQIDDTLLWGYTHDQLQFCTDNERQMWEYLVENKKLFISDGFIVSQFINEAPYTKEFSVESPGKAAVWQGYRIVESFMRHNKEITPEQLMDEVDYQKILNLSKYNP